ncbi:MAG: nickel pincer cofactor biosynthesis protein LarB [Sedimentisphaerales bacterium]|nr:nickel pincer cofactor biosynthesis protein LarB [Sedimentisphaerales bacterium]
MNTESLRQLLEKIQSSKITIDQALDHLKHLPFESLDFANVDHHRHLRCGMGEAIYCPGKTTDQIVKIFASLADKGSNVLATRADQRIYDAIAAKFPQAKYESVARAVTLRQQPFQPSQGHITLVSAGTSDIPVAEEARVTAELLNQSVKTVYDVGVAGLHRLLARCETLQSANVVIVVAGMEGALASVVGGLVDKPVIAVPTSVGYGTSFGGIAPLLTMLNSCAAGVCVVNIDNGFAAGAIAAMINRLAEPKKDY